MLKLKKRSNSKKFKFSKVQKNQSQNKKTGGKSPTETSCK
jgi:hypothetical protein